MMQYKLTLEIYMNNGYEDRCKESICIKLDLIFEIDLV